MNFSILNKDNSVCEIRLSLNQKEFSDLREELRFYIIHTSFANIEYPTQAEQLLKFMDKETNV